MSDDRSNQDQGSGNGNSGQDQGQQNGNQGGFNEPGQRQQDGGADDARRAPDEQERTGDEGLGSGEEGLNQQNRREEARNPS